MNLTALVVFMLKEFYFFNRPELYPQINDRHFWAIFSGTPWQLGRQSQHIFAEQDFYLRYVSIIFAAHVDDYSRVIFTHKLISDALALNVFIAHSKIFVFSYLNKLLNCIKRITNCYYSIFQRYSLFYCYLPFWLSCLPLVKIVPTIVQFSLQEDLKIDIMYLLLHYEYHFIIY